MTEHTHNFPDWPFPDRIATATFCTDKVAREGFDVLRVVHDFNGDWQFLDGTTDEPGECVMLCLGCLFEKHSDIAAIADLPRGWGACRDAAGAKWERWELEPEDEQDDDEEDVPHNCGGPEADAKALADIEKYGLHVISVLEEDEHPPFTYSIGIEQSLGMPELIVIGLKSNIACSVINECYRQMKERRAIAPGERIAGLLGGDFECVIGEASAEQVADYMHWASWLNKGGPFRAYQIIWPSTTGVFPWEPGASDWLIARQPLLA
ncbi:hypothetical protein RugamoR57_04850 [Duganella caerulea]|uniref:DUF4262 domain-containing protein n=1 Tax=Duganella caerulea TaxID=2885762 RepID=UPI0030EABD86